MTWTRRLAPALLAPALLLTCAATPAGASHCAADGTALAASGSGVISGSVISDRNADGRLDPADGDSPIAGAAVILSGDIDAATSTGPDGRYAFPAPAGTYRLTAPQPAGFHDGPDVPGAGAAHDGNDALCVTLPAGGSSDGNTFAEHGRAGVSGFLFDDLDGDGAPGPDEPGALGVALTLSGTDEVGTAIRLSTTAAPDGRYAFPRLRPGAYELSRAAGTGLLSGVVRPGAAGGTPASRDTITGITLGPAAATGYDFASNRPAGLSGAVVDAAGGGVPGVAVTVRGQTAAGEAVERPLRTDANGLWTVPDLPGGTYTVVTPVPAGYGDGPNTPGAAGGMATEPDTIDGIALAGGQQAGGYTFTLTTASIGGTVFVDVDGNGARGPGEPGVGGVPVTVTGTDAAGGPVERTESTGPDGYYRVGELLAGRYSVSETQARGYGDGADTAGSAGGSRTGTDTVTGAAPSAGTAATGYDFAELGARLSGAVVDERGTGLADVPVALAGTDLAGGDVDRDTTTGADGTFAVSGLPAGEYIVSTARPEGYGEAPDVPGNAGGAASGPDTLTRIVIGAGAAASGYRLVHGLGSVAGRVFVDRDADGVRDAGEPGVGTAEIVLTGTDVTGAAVRRTATSGADGRYRLDGLLAGDYAVTGLASEYGGGDRPGVPLATAADTAGLDIGMRAGTLGGLVVDHGGGGIAGATVTVSGTTVGGVGTSGTATAGPDGSWAVTDLPAGTYTVSVRQPASYGDGPDVPGTAGGRVAAPNRISGIELAPGQAGAGYRFTGTLGAVAGRVTVGGGTGLAQVTVGLTGTAVTGEPVERSIVTGPDGDYRLDGLPAGRYRLVETQPAGYESAGVRPGTAGGRALSPDAVAGITLGAGVEAGGYDFDEHPARPEPDRTASMPGEPRPGR